jgi:hydroxymethylbilane synthase
MGREPDAAEVLAVREMLPGPGQGALGLEIRDGDSAAEQAALALHHRPTWSCARAEREVVAGLGWSAYVPLGAFAEIEGEEKLRLRAAVFGPAGEHLASAEACDSPQRATMCARTVVEDLRTAGAEDVLRGQVPGTWRARASADCGLPAPRATRQASERASPGVRTLRRPERAPPPGTP